MKRRIDPGLVMLLTLVAIVAAGNIALIVLDLLPAYFAITAIAAALIAVGLAFLQARGGPSE